MTSLSYIAISQRVDVWDPHCERRDSLDHRWYYFLESCSLQAITLPNHATWALHLMQNLPLRGLLLTGGNTLPCCGKSDAPERDETEKTILEEALKQAIPVLGVCRGMQFLQHYWGVTLNKIPDHVDHHHTIRWENGEARYVNSFHHFGTTTSSSHLKTMAKSPEGIIEAVESSDKKVAGIMWHPERFSPFHKEDTALFKRVFYA